jgi:hypothetical protein
MALLSVHQVTDGFESLPFYRCPPCSSQNCLKPWIFSIHTSMYSDQKTQIQMQNYGCLNESSFLAEKTFTTTRHCLIIVIILQNTDIVLFFFPRTTTTRWGNTRQRARDKKSVVASTLAITIRETRARTKKNERP